MQYTTLNELLSSTDAQQVVVDKLAKLDKAIPQFGLGTLLFNHSEFAVKPTGTPLSTQELMGLTTYFAERIKRHSRTSGDYAERQHGMKDKSLGNLVEWYVSRHDDVPTKRVFLEYLTIARPEMNFSDQKKLCAEYDLFEKVSAFVKEIPDEYKILLPICIKQYGGNWETAIKAWEGSASPVKISAAKKIGEKHAELIADRKAAKVDFQLIKAYTLLCKKYGVLQP